MMRSTVLIAVALIVLSPLACGDATGPSAQLLANVVSPNDVNAVSAFHSCQGHAYPQPTAPSSAKNYLWPTSTNFSSDTLIKLFAACSGKVDQSVQDRSADQQIRGRTIHLYCDGSSTRLKYFHVNFESRILGQHLQAGDVIGTASLLGSGGVPPTAWQYSSNFDVAVSDGNDDNTRDYFKALGATAFAAWSARGISASTATARLDNPTCSAYNGTFGAPDVILLSPAR